MMYITEKSSCCGCSACAQSCPKQCIGMTEDEEGFLYPVVDASVCIDCKLCEKVCPFLNSNDVILPKSVEVAINQDNEMRLESSSGGIFSLLAEHVINKGGVVFGARFDDEWDVIHDYTECIEGLSAFRGSKYVQSEIRNSFQEAKRFLDDGRSVLFSGTPCQINALKRFLKKDYKNLYCVDVVCHGVPSPLAWKDYLSHINPNDEEILSVKMRDKSRGWSKYSYKIVSKQGALYDNFAANSEYLRMYINGFIVRPSCFDCPVKGGKSHSDITLADAWGIKEVYPEMDDDQGASVVCIYTDAGMSLYNAVSKVSRPFPEEVLYKANPSYYKNAISPQFREKFWDLYKTQGVLAYYGINKMMTPPLFKRLFQKLFKAFNFREK